jgi:hypothetical protein
VGAQVVAQIAGNMVLLDVRSKMSGEPVKRELVLLSRDEALPAQVREVVGRVVGSQAPAEGRS